MSDNVRTVLVGALAYATLVLFLRISGKRTLEKLNAFDLALTVAPGSALEVLRSEPTLLARAGQFCSDAMRHERVTKDEAVSAIRSAGGRDVKDVAFLVLESDGTIYASLLPSRGGTAP